MPSALETLVKILKLEQETGYKNTAVIGGLQSFAEHWSREAHQQAKRPEHHQLIDELVYYLDRYPALVESNERHEEIKFLLGRITGRIPPRPDRPAFDPTRYAEAAPPPPAVVAPPVRREPERQEKPRRPAPQEEPDEPEDELVSGARSGDEMDEDLGDAQAANDDDLDAADGELHETVRFVPLTPAPRPVAPPPHRARRPQLSPEQATAQIAELQAPVTALHKVGAKMAEKLNRLGINTLEEMLFTLPRRYDDYTQMCPLNRLKPGEAATVAAAVRSTARKRGRGGRPYLLVMVEDGTGEMQVTFFGQLWLERQFKRDSQVVFSGTVELFRGQLIMTNPEWEMLERENLHTNRIVPIYPLTTGLSARTMRRLMHQAVEEWSGRLLDYVPDSVLERVDLPDLNWALRQTHFPDSMDWLSHARRRLSFDELFVFQMAMLTQRRDWQSQPGQPLQVDEAWLAQAQNALPYTLTGAQQRALGDILADLASAVPMNRLLQGDVGSGKTVVAAIALAAAYHNGKQGALMVPTSILAEQHARTLSRLLALLPGGDSIQVRLLTGNTGEQERHEILAGLAEGRVHVLIGTHALIQQSVEFGDLALVVIDEQHRFGVAQRGVLRGKGTHPHLLVMTATPIPRTLALTLHADLDLSTIDEMPPGRIPVDTRVLQIAERERAYSFIQSQLDKGRQAFIVYPLVETSERLEDVGAAVEEYERLKKDVFPKHRMGLLHGRMRPAEKDEVMAAFAAGDVEVLVSTSVVEVGIDVPNASVILIAHADRFGLAQLHQFRGRVGRGEHPSFCLLLADSVSSEAWQRLSAMEETTDGFRLAEIDWELRGPGDLMGLRQSGTGQFRLAELMNPRLVELAQREARTVYAEDPHLERPEHFLLAQRIGTVVNWRADVS